MLASSQTTANEEEETLQEAETELRRTASSLREVAESGTTPVFAAIAAFASEAEADLADFLASEAPRQKFEVYARFRESRRRWRARLEDMHSLLTDGTESTAATEAPDPEDTECCLLVEDSAFETSCQVAAAYESCENGNSPPGDAGGYPVALPSSPVAEERTSRSSFEPMSPPATSDASTLPEAQEGLLAYLRDEEDGFLTVLTNAVEKVRNDDRFEGVHDDAGAFLEQMKLAAAAITPLALAPDLSEDLAGAEQKLQLTVEAMRKAQWGGFNAKKQAFTVQKYDLYKRKGKMPKLADEHAQLLECAKVGVDLAEYLRRIAQQAIMDSVIGLVAKTGAAASETSSPGQEHDCNAQGAA
eukprot:TRINITY_DN111437_c0_g1_i1.p1 TRINITY_DN111437_c0_g1~~TRINITY_DN111437_c0_g1_i1.p1  ORF type:complete len:359 (-),score=96.06 TRINITY_DN111437_c0_g1_i1:11-1087(-)